MSHQNMLEPPDSKTCASCGAKNNENNTTCVGCGTSL